MGMAMGPKITARISLAAPPVSALFELLKLPNCTHILILADPTQYTLLLCRYFSGPNGAMLLPCHD
jgi:hypothetical protein